MTVETPRIEASTIFWTIGRARTGRRSYTIESVTVQPRAREETDRQTAVSVGGYALLSVGQIRREFSNREDGEKLDVDLESSESLHDVRRKIEAAKGMIRTRITLSDENDTHLV